MASDEELYAQYLKETNQGQPSDEELYQQYLKETGQVVEDIEAQDIIKNEMPEGLGVSRAIVKNLAGSPEAAFNFLQKEHKDFEFKKDAKGEILARKRGQEAWGRLDPKGFDLQDISDIGYDVVAAGGQGAATAAAGLAGGAATLPAGGVGALPAAIAASGASGAGLEAIRQALGSAAGLEDNISGTDIAIAGGTGAVSPLLFGTGAAVKEAGKYALKQGLGELEKKALIQAQKGLGGKAWDWGTKQIGSRLAGIAGGYPKEVVQAAGENLDLIKASEKHPEVAVKILEENKDLFVNSLNKARRETGKQLENLSGEIDKLGATVSTQKVLAPLTALREKLAGAGLQNEARRDSLEVVDNIIAKHFQVGEEIPLELSTAQVQQLRNELKELAIEKGLKFKDAGSTKGASQASGALNKDILNALHQTSDVMKSETDKVVRKVAPEMKDQLDSLNSMYSGYKELQDEFYNATKSEDAFKSFIKKQGVVAESAKKKMSEIAGKDINELAAQSAAIDIFRNPRWQIPAFGGSNTARTLGAGALGGYLGAAAGQAAGGSTYLPTMIGAGLGSVTASPAMIRKYMGLNKIVRDIPKSELYKYAPYLMMQTANQRGK